MNSLQMNIAQVMFGVICHTHGLLKESHLPGVVITPACDLANDKVETISYLPIIPIRNYLATTSFLPEIKNAMLGISDQLNYTEFRTTYEPNLAPKYA